MLPILPILTLWAQTPGPDIDPQAATGGLIDAASASQIGAAIGFGLMLVVFICQRIYNHLASDPVSTEWLPWFACGIATVGAAAVGLVEGALWYNIIWAAVSAWIAAMGEYQAIKNGGRLVKKLAGKAPSG